MITRSLAVDFKRLGNPLLFLCVTALALTHAAPAHAQTHDPAQWGADGSVLAMQAVGDTLFIGGRFHSMGPVSGGFGILDPVSARALPISPRVDGRVRAVLPDGRGGWYVGGSFHHINGTARSNLAHLYADGSVDAWDPVVEGAALRLAPFSAEREFDIDAVNAIARVGDVLFIGGNFSRVGGGPHRDLAAIDLKSGRARPWNLDVVAGPDEDVFVADIKAEGSTLYVGGKFRGLAGGVRDCLASLDARTGRLLQWDPRASDAVFRLAIADQVVFVGGEFDHVGGAFHNCLAAIDRASGRVRDWDARILPLRRYLAHGDWDWPWVTALLIRGQTLYVGGSFEEVAGERRSDLASVDQRSARATRFDPQPDRPVIDLALQNDRLFVAGQFSRIQGAARSHLASIDLSSNRLLPWQPVTPAMVACVSPSRNAVLIGGDFRRVDPWTPRAGLAALQASTGRLLPWDPGCDGQVNVMLLDGQRLYVAGDLGSLAGQVRHHLGRFDVSTGALAPWTPGVSGAISALAIRGSTLYVGGDFLSVDGVASRALGAIDTETGHLLDWRAAWLTPFNVSALCSVDDHLYVAGGLYAHSPDYSLIRNVLVDVSAISGSWGAWNPVAGPPYSLDYGFSHLLAFDGHILATGWFHELGGQVRDGIAVVDTVTGKATAWDADAGSGQVEGRSVTAVAITDHDVFVGGEFSQFAGQARTGLAVLDRVTGAPGAWAPAVDGDRRYGALIASLSVAGGRVYVGGELYSVDGAPCSGFTAFQTSAAKPAASRAAAQALRNAGVRFATPFPDPAAASATLAFSLPRSASVCLEVHDLQGRKVLTALDVPELPAGAHSVSIAVGDWRPGVYFCSLQTAGVRITRRLLVMR